MEVDIIDAIPCPEKRDCAQCQMETTRCTTVELLKGKCEEQHHHHHHHRHVPFLKRTSVQICLFMTVIVCCIGPYNGINAMGGGGLSDHLLATKMNTLYCLTLSLAGWLGGVAFNSFGVPIVSCVGACCYTVYLSGLLSISAGFIDPRYSYVCGASLGVGASLLWATFGAISIRYPTSDEQGSTFTYMWAAVNLGAFLAGLLSVLKTSGSESQSTTGTYITFILLTMFGTILAMTMLIHQKNVIKSDGHHVESHSCDSVKSAIKDALTALSDPQLRLLIPLFLLPNAHMPFLFNGINGQYFNLRTRSINSCIYWLVRGLGGFAFHRMVKRRSEGGCIARRLLPGYYLTYIWASTTLVISFIVVFDYNFNGENMSSLDISNDIRLICFPISMFIMFGMVDSLLQAFIYSLLGSLSGANTEEAAIFSGFYKSLQSLGLGTFWLLDWIMPMSIFSIDRYQYHWMFIAAFWIVAFPGTLITMLRLRASLGPQEEEGSIISSFSTLHEIQ